MEAPMTPEGYPPPTLVRNRGGVLRGRTLILAPIVVLAVTIAARSHFFDDKPAPPPVPAAKRVVVGPNGVGDADSAAEALPDSSRLPGGVAGLPDNSMPAQPSPDARQPNRWYYVSVLGDGPGAIYSRTGGSWSFAFACTLKTRMIEFIAVGTGAPGDFDKQAISVGKVKLMMDATYSKEGGGTIITALPAAHPFLKALDGAAQMEVQLYATHRSIVPIGPEVNRLMTACRNGA